MFKLLVIKVSPNTLRHSKIQAYRIIQCIVLFYKSAKNCQIFGAESKSKIDKVYLKLYLPMIICA